jgi:hypothetical protein
VRERSRALVSVVVNGTVLQVDRFERRRLDGRRSSRTRTRSGGKSVDEISAGEENWLECSWGCHGLCLGCRLVWHGSRKV